MLNLISNFSRNSARTKTSTNNNKTPQALPGYVLAALVRKLLFRSGALIDNHTGKFDRMA